MSLFDKLNQVINEAPVGKDDTILPNKKDSDKDKNITKKNIKKYPIKEPKTPSQPEVGYGGKASGFKLTAGVKQSEVSKDAKEFTKDINKANVKRQETVSKRKYHRGRKAQRAVYKDGLTKDQRVTNIKRDIEVKDAIKIAGGSGDVSPTAPKRIRDRVTKIRSDRAIKAGTPDPFLPKKEYTALKKKFTPKGEKDVIKNLDKKVTTSLDKPTIPTRTVKVPEKKGLKKAISDIRASEKRLYDAGVGKKPSLVQQRKAGKEAIRAFNLKKQREIRAYQTDYVGDGSKGLGNYSRAAGQVVKKVPREKRMPPVGGVLGKDPKKFATFTPQKGSKTPPLVKVDNKKAVSGTYSMGGGERTITDRKKRVEKIIGDSKARKNTTLDQDKLNQAIGGKDAKGNILDKETRKKLFQQSRGKTFTGGGSGGGKKPPLIGTGGFGGGGKKPNFGKAAFKSKALKFGGKLKNFAKANPLATALAVGAVGYYGYQGIKRAIEGPQLDPRKDFTKTGKIQYGSGSTKADRTDGSSGTLKKGDPVRFTYGRKETKNRAKPFLTPDTKKADGSTTQGSLSKFKKNIYTVKDSSGKTIDVNKRIQNSAFTKQLRDASTSKKQSAQDFIKKYKKAAEYRGITT